MAQIEFHIGNKINIKKYDGGPNLEMNLHKMVKCYLRSEDRIYVANVFKYNKPNDFTLLKLIYDANPTAKILFIANNIFRKYSQDYFYELLAFSYEPQKTKRIKRKIK